MDFAVIQGKNPGASWDKIVSHSKKTRKALPKAAPSPSARPASIKTESEHSLLKVMAEIIGLTAILFGLVQGYRFLTSSPALAIKGVEINGTRRVSNEGLMAWAGPIGGKNILTVDLSALAQKLESHPWIREVSVERKLPDTIRIHASERAPMMRIRLDKVYLVDTYGILLEEASEGSGALPVITGIRAEGMAPGDRVNHPALAPSLRMMHFLNELPYFRENPVNTVSVEGPDRAVFVTSKDPVRIRMALDDPDRTFENLKAALGAMEGDPASIVSIDLLFRDQVVVTSAPNTAKTDHRS